MTRSRTIEQDVVTSLALARQAQVLIAADCVYDRARIPALVQSVARLLLSTTGEGGGSGKNKDNDENRKCAIFATTYRNEETFGLFESELIQAGIQCDYVPIDEIENLPHIFPCYDDQPRSDVRICIMTK